MLDMTPLTDEARLQRLFERLADSYVGSVERLPTTPVLAENGSMELIFRPDGISTSFRTRLRILEANVGELIGVRNIDGNRIGEEVYVSSLYMSAIIAVVCR
jgi:hypothetical protein